MRVHPSKPHVAGDSHNFGRRVTVHGRRVAKPRTLFWEWLVLSGKSPLRRALAETETDFDFLPDLAFHPTPPDARKGGEVERVELTPLSAAFAHGEKRRLLARVVGRALATFSWLGLADLHWENLVLGVGPRGRVVYAPLDVEMILADLSRPTETKLLPDADPEYAELCRHAAGVRRALPWLGKPIEPSDLVAMVAAYRKTLGLLNHHAATLAKSIASLKNVQDAPIRIILRSTGDYVSGDHAALWPPLLAAETEQLARGDVPYFFRLYGQKGIRYFGDATLATDKRLPSSGDVPQLDPMLSLARSLRAPSRARLAEEGLFTVIGAFDHPSYRGEVVADDLSITFGARKLTVRPADQGADELETRRNLGAFVGSVYLPCRCGEVRSVFVPPVTVCEARGAW